MMLLQGLNRKLLLGKRRLKAIGFNCDLYCFHLSSLIAPVSAFVAFIFLRSYVEVLLHSKLRKIKTHTASSSEKLMQFKKQRQDRHQEEPSMEDRQTYNHHGLYITDIDVAFLTDVEGCSVSPNSSVIQKRAQNYRNGRFDAVFLICSKPDNAKHRQAARQLYGTFQNTRPYKIKIVFLVGLVKNKDAEAHLANESLTHGDILQGNFVDHYFNLSYKTIMGYRWAQRNCLDVKIVCKIDDDVFVDIFKFFDYFLPVISLRTRVIYGYLNSKPRVHRKGKYWVGEEEFSGTRYPQFCNGFFVVPTRDVIADIYDISKTVRFFRLEDVFTYGLVREAMLDVQLVHVDVITHYFLKYQNCINDHKYRCKYLAAEMSSDQMLKYHRLAMEHRTLLALSGGGN